MILAAGGGTRLYPLTFDCAKPMVPVLNCPVMEHIIGLLRRHGITQLIANLHHYADQISSYFGDGSRFGVALDYSREEVILGTAGGAKNVASFFGDDTFIIVGGDDLADFDLAAMMAFHRERQALATIAVVPVEHVSEYGIVVADEQGRILSFQEKPKPEDALSNLANTGVYMLEPGVLDFVPAGEFFDFGKQVFPLLREKAAPFFAWPAAGYWKDIGNPREYLEANMDALDGRMGIAAAGSQTLVHVWTEHGVAAEGIIEAPAAIGGECRLEKGSRVARSVIGPRVIVGAGAGLDGCVVWPGVAVPSISARSAVIAPGCVVWG